MPTLDLRPYGPDGIAGIRTLLLDIHDDAYADSTSEFNTRERFSWFVDHWSARPGFSCVIGYDGTEAVGYAYGAPLAASSAWWKDVAGLSEAATREDGMRTFALSELMVTQKRRKTGAAVQIHDALLALRTETRVTLTVDTTHPKVRALYERWGYTRVGSSKPFDDSPTFDVMLRELLPPSRP
ncbi:GNAT family N-acetyltransferase [Streptomyces sp. NPDC020379]|uniref:GNAT family N-acetyltransferase n=1 Tax=Streptomyces sp. NPDC020379 TaxID=3365071 RepID=UPI0037B8F296